jgi:hypothetical protein
MTSEPVGEATARTDEPTFIASQTLAMWIFAGALAVVLGALAIPLYFGSRAPEHVLSGDELRLGGGMFSTLVHRRDVEGVSLQETIPPARKKAGMVAMPYQRGVFEVQGMGTADLLVTRGYPPFLVIHRKEKNAVIINFKDANETHSLYAQLRSAWDLP